MREQNKIFHLAIPCKNLEETVEFYSALGCEAARRYEDRVTFNFFGDQLVCHLSPENIDPDPQMYPRHFGITFVYKEEFDQLIEHAIKQNLPFFLEPSLRWKGRSDEHITFFLIDPSNNLLEFKYYKNREMVY